MLFHTSWGGLLLLLLSCVGCAGMCGYVCVKALVEVLDPAEAVFLTADEMARREQRLARQRVEAGLQPCCLTQAPRRPPWTIKQAWGAPTHR